MGRIEGSEQFQNKTRRWIRKIVVSCSPSRYFSQDISLIVANWTCRSDSERHDVEECSCGSVHIRIQSRIHCHMIYNSLKPFERLIMAMLVRMFEKFPNLSIGGSKEACVTHKSRHPTPASGQSLPYLKMTRIKSVDLPIPRRTLFFTYINSLKSMVYYESTERLEFNIFYSKSPP